MKLKNNTSIIIILIHIIAIIGIFIITNISIITIIFQFILSVLSGVSITGGYHRLWAHNTYKANSLLEIFYLIFGTMATEGSAILWAKEHRTHHRNEEKPGDPYNINKGFFHAHIGWLLVPSDKIEIEEISKTDVSDLENNKLLLFQDKYYIMIWISLFIFTCFIMKLWNDSIINIIFSNIIRIVIVLNITWCINSVAHTIGEKPYNNNIKAANNSLLGILTLGEGWHNYHHSYPKDYRASEKDKTNFTTFFINLTKKYNLSYNHYYNDNNNIPNNERFNTNFYKILK
jgi:stearoyl-CoA desaturase (Delta-9 desaturase)